VTLAFDERWTEVRAERGWRLRVEVDDAMLAAALARHLERVGSKQVECSGEAVVAISPTSRPRRRRSSRSPSTSACGTVAASKIRLVAVARAASRRS